MRRIIALFSGALVLLAAASISATPVAAEGDFQLESTIAFTSSRDDPTNQFPILAAGEIYLMNPDGTNPRRLTDNDAGDFLPALSPDGKKIVFDSNRTQGESLYTSDLFLMNTDGTEQTFLTRGSSATWSPDSKSIAFHASASGTGCPLRNQPGTATSDNDIFRRQRRRPSGGRRATHEHHPQLDREQRPEDQDRR